MFTGLIEDTGRVRAAESGLLIVETRLAAELAPGDSMAVDGVCLSLEKAAAGKAFFRVSPETLSRAAPVKPGSIVNLERPLRFDGRLHGHLVTGHVDCTGTVVSLRRRGSFSSFDLSCPGRWHTLLVEKGSVAVSGISLTVADLLPGVGFTVAVIPETLSRTRAGDWRPGTVVNLEFDIIGKYIQRAMAFGDDRAGLREKLEQM